MTKKKVIQGILIFGVYVAVFVFLIQYITGNADIMRRIAASPLPYVFAGMSCTAICIMLSGLLDVSCARVYGVKVRYWESIGLTYIASAINLVLPLQMGSVIKAMYLKKKMTLPYTKYISIVSGTIVINLMVTFVQLILCLILSSIRLGVSVFYTAILTGIFAAGILCFVLALFFQNGILKILPFKKLSVPILQGFFELMGNRRAMLLVTLNLIVSALLGGLRFSFIFRMLEFGGGILEGMLYYGCYTASSIIPILPGNVGISETIVGIMNTILGSDFDIGVTVVLVSRIYNYLITIVGAILFALPIWIRYNQNNGEDK